jgi:hypothetical protein
VQKRDGADLNVIPVGRFWLEDEVSGWKGMAKVCFPRIGFELLRPMVSWWSIRVQ